MTKLKIAQISPNIFPVPPIDHGGTERIVADLCTALSCSGHDVTLFAPSDSATESTLVSRLPSLAALEREYGKVPPSIPAVLEAVQMELLRRRLHEFDVVHCHGEFAHAAMLGERRGRSVTTIHWRVDELDRRLFFAAFPDLPVAAISASQESGIPLPNRAGIVHHGIERDRYAPSFEPGRHLAFVGRMTDQKRPDTAIRVARAAGLPIRLAGTVDVGNPTYFEREVRPLLGGDAVYLGPLADGPKRELLAGASALLLPVDWPEPFGLVMIEAMACGTPVVAWNRGSVREVVEDGVTGFVVENEAEALEALGRIGELDRRLIRQRFEARFTADRMAADYVAIYRTLMERACASA
ncbi:glycosyltransferase family 4 protein [Aureimonas leprariae]|uniref:Glycosyltransferase family 4 protein n=1 Tax=Plantimonas leprariae TaxID=2615207 RepID=A0A7V7PST3_9HYPH|nr:glycosyltransferase family 4 protein [Aureimonas leprariae]KAB0682631.1 glycosyltransferase family 4 protein [Aureimonas leprariae]